MLGAEERRIADDRGHLRPCDLEGVALDDVGERDQREHGLDQAVPIGGELVPHPEHHSRDPDSELVDLDPVEVGERVPGSVHVGHLRAGSLIGIADAPTGGLLQGAELSVRDIEEVAATASRIENVEAAQIGKGSLRLVGCGRGSYAARPWLYDRRADDLHDVGLVCVVDSQLGAAVAQAAREDGAEDRRVDLPPVVAERLGVQLELRALQVHPGRVGEEASVGIGDSGVDAALRRRLGLVEGVEEEAELGRAGAVWVLDEPLDNALDRVFGQEPEALGEEAPDALQHEVAQHRRLRGAPVEE